MQKIIITAGALIFLSALFAIRLFFFLAADANQVGSVLLAIMIYVGSLALATYVFAWPLSRFFAVVSTYRALFVMVLALTALELLLFQKNGISPRRIYPFGLLATFAMLISFTRLLPAVTRKPFAIFFVTAYTGYLLLQDMYFHVFNDFASFLDLTALPGALRSADTPYAIWPFVPAVLMTVTGLLFITARTKAYTRLFRNAKTLFVMAGVWALLLTLLNLNAQYSRVEGTIHMDDYALLANLEPTDAFAGTYGMIHFAARDLFQTITPPYTSAAD